MGRAQGATVAEIWKTISAGRDVARTTVLNLVGRLDKRGWLKREKHGGVYRYVATVDRETTSANVASKFVNDFFGGSTSDLVMSLLGSRRISKAEVEQLRQILKSAGIAGRKS